MSEILNKLLETVRAKKVEEQGAGARAYSLRRSVGEEGNQEKIKAFLERKTGLEYSEIEKELKRMVKMGDSNDK